MGFKIMFEELSLQVKAVLKKSPRCHDWEHTLRVLHNAERLSVKINDVDIKVIKLGALLHDIARADEMAIKGKICHARKGAQIAAVMLRDNGFDKETIKSVVKCVRRHRYKSNQAPVSLEEKIIYDADKLDSLGAVGIGRAFLFAGHIDAVLHNRAEVAMASLAYSENDTAYREYLVKQSLIPEKMLTKNGKKIAIKRVKFMKKYFDRLNKEVYG